MYDKHGKKTGSIRSHGPYDDDVVPALGELQRCESGARHSCPVQTHGHLPGGAWTVFSQRMAVSLVETWMFYHRSGLSVHTSGHDDGPDFRLGHYRPGISGPISGRGSRGAQCGSLCGPAPGCPGHVPQPLRPVRVLSQNI